MILTIKKSLVHDKNVYQRGTKKVFQNFKDNISKGFPRFFHLIRNPFFPFSL